ncbi:MAG TPA: glycosyltransferase family 39 protein [Gemmatimonadales bacterium]|nr:glycosyltransferase family 39 protein [Gemmatimonadales bacterium]
MTGAPNPPQRPWTSRALLLVLVLGAVYRLVPFFQNPSLIVDDAMLALNVATRSFGGLLRPLDLYQAASPAFLWALKLLTLGLGVNEFALRALPLLAGLVLPYSVWALAGRLRPGSGDPVPVIAAALAAFSPIILQYSVSAKPYVVDALATTIVLHCALGVLDHPDERRVWWKLMAAGTGALLFSTPSVFVLGGVALTLGVSGAGRRGVALMAGVWGFLFGVIYFAIMRPESVNPYMRTFWAARFLSATTLAHPGMAWDVVKRLPAGTLLTARGTDEPTVLLWGLAAFGAWRLWHRNPGRTALLLAPLVAVLAAATLSLYPISPRLDVFAAPIGFLLFAAAWDWTEGLGRAVRIGSRAAAVLLVLGVAMQGVKTTWAPGIRSIARVPRGVAPAYVFCAAIPAWVLYTTDWRHPDTARVREILATQTAEGEAFFNAAGRGRAVSDTEGIGLRVRDGDRVELLGLAPGIQYREGEMFSQGAPDPGWAARETERIRDAGANVWVVAVPTNSAVVRELLDSLKGRGARETVVRMDHQAALLQLHFQP